VTGPVIVGVDTATSTGAAELGAELARSLGSGLVLAHVARDPLVFPYGDAQIRALLRGKEADACRVLARHAACVEGVPVEFRVDFGLPAAGLRRMANELEASFLVLAPRRRRALTPALSTGTTAAVAASSPCPVVALPPPGRARGAGFSGGGPIVLGVDGAESSDHAAAVADALAHRLELPLLPVGIDVAEGATENVVRYRNVHRHPGQALAEVARRARGSMLVVGTAGGSWSSGSVAQRLIAQAPIPLVVVLERQSPPASYWRRRDSGGSARASASPTAVSSAWSKAFSMSGKSTRSS
jgi:nucleotide-binding universal stress UspA family protein